jgi:hypothetical protein
MKHASTFLKLGKSKKDETIEKNDKTMKIMKI